MPIIYCKATTKKGTQCESRASLYGYCMRHKQLATKEEEEAYWKEQDVEALRRATRDAAPEMLTLLEQGLAEVGPGLYVCLPVEAVKAVVAKATTITCASVP